MRSHSLRRLAQLFKEDYEQPECQRFFFAGCFLLYADDTSSLPERKIGNIVWIVLLPYEME